MEKFFGIKKWFDSFYNQLNPFVQTAIAFFAFCANFDFGYLKHRYPDWIYQFNFFSHISIYILLILVSISCITSWLYNRCIRKTLVKLDEDLRKESEKNNVIANNIRNLFDGYLYHLATEKLDFKPATEHRITLYIHDGENKFVPFGRYSGNPKYKKINRSEYPDDQGCIAQAWQNRWCFENGLTDANYIQRSQNVYKMLSRTIQRMTMKSKVYAAMQIRYSGEAIAVIVVESTDVVAFDENIRQYLEQEESII